MIPDSYAGFAERYDLSFGPFGEHEPQVVEFFRRLFAQNKVHTMLDCACGTGRHLPLFHSLGCEVFGSDISEAMLAQARSNLAEYGLEAPLCQLDFRDLPGHLRRQFDAVVCLGSIGFMPDEPEFSRAFTSMGAVLREGGLLVLTAMPTDRQWKEKPRFLLAANRPDFTRLFVVDYFEDRAWYNVVDISNGDEMGGLQVWSAELHVLLRDDQERLLKTAGFRKVDFFGVFDFTPYDRETSPSLITVAYK
jgi:SAM-dependent methyltransferase